MNHKDTKAQREVEEQGTHSDGLHDHRGRPLDRAVQQLSYEVVGAAIEVHRALGPGWLEAAYEEALCVELSSRRIPFVRQREVQLLYKGRKVGEGHVDILVENCLVLELKAVSALSNIHVAQTLTYLRLTGCRLGLLINFHVALLRDGIERVVL